MRWRVDVIGQRFDGLFIVLVLVTVHESETESFFQEPGELFIVDRREGMSSICNGGFGVLDISFASVEGTGIMLLLLLLV
jgi:hypothetical protein